ncbi:peptidoglycan-binding domain-containing protein [Cellulosimicrobium cellulans]|uniref:peptidoglycan-binding domain-containing protein n=1 Tax=Cellulosimicrobium cellulans TaxID=1710 RepID=UPI00130E53A5|nr:peptidoglycan-binding domain-containing protein [Cellulosimicrobium cellulans]
MSLVVAGTLVGGLVGGWFAAERLQSPAQVAARAEPPKPSDILATVTVGELTEQVTARSEIVRESASSVEVALAGAEQSVVTANRVPPGSDLRPGAAVLEVNGRPVIATTGAFPYYRDMAEGDTGPDVEQLQRFLISCGYRTGGVGQFGPQTAWAVRQLYRAIGHEVVLREEAAPSDGTTATGAQSVAAAVPAGPSSEEDPEGGPGEPPADEGAAAPAATRQVVVVPRSELIVLGSLPVVTGDVPAVGTVLTPENSALTFGQGQVVARAKIAVTVLPVLAEGMPVVLTGADGTTMDGTLGPVPAVTVGGEDASAEVAVPLVTEAIDEAWLDANVLTVITVTAVADQALRVPSRAVVPRADGSWVVLRRAADGSFEEIAVRELGRLGGTSAIEPTATGGLSEGDEVKVE